MSDFLAEMARSSTARSLAAQVVLPLEQLRARCEGLPSAPPLVSHGGFDLIAEIKLRAPSVGQLAAPPANRAGFVAERAARYTAAGAAAISVLTEPSRFDGTLTDLPHAVSAAAPVPIMRKDFIVHAYQVWQARAAGAGGVLLIVRMLDDAHLVAMLDAAEQAGLFVLLEAFDAADLHRAADHAGGRPGVIWLGVNTRDLSTLQVDPDRLERLQHHLPPDRICVAESGLRVPADAARVRGWGYRAALVGSALMAAPDPGALASAMLHHGRSACG